MENDPVLNFDSDFSEIPKSHSSDQHLRVSNKKTDLSSKSKEDEIKVCPIHKTNHTLSKCRAFREMTLSDKTEIFER